MKCLKPSKNLSFFTNNSLSLFFLFSSDINECEAEPCKNGGICTDLVANYSCECPGEFMGRNCQYSKYSHIYEYLYMYIYPLFASLSLIMEFGSKSVIASGVYNEMCISYLLLPNMITIDICCYQI